MSHGEKSIKTKTHLSSEGLRSLNRAGKSRRCDCDVLVVLGGGHGDSSRVVVHVRTDDL